MEQIYQAKVDRQRSIFVATSIPFLAFGFWFMFEIVKICYPYIINYRPEELYGLIYGALLFLMMLAFTWFILIMFLSMSFNRMTLYYDRVNSKIKINDFCFNIYLLPQWTTYQFDISSIEKIIRYEDINKTTLNHSFFVLDSDHIASFPYELYKPVTKLKKFEIEVVDSNQMSVREFGKKYHLKNRWWWGFKSQSIPTN